MATQNFVNAGHCPNVTFTYRAHRDMVQATPPMLFKRNYSPSRRSRRQWINGSIQVFDGPQQFSAFGINLSEGGMGFFAAANLRVGSQVAIEFVPPGESTLARRAAKIRHRALYLYGVEFLASAGQSGRSPESLAQQHSDVALLRPSSTP